MEAESASYPERRLEEDGSFGAEWSGVTAAVRKARGDWGVEGESGGPRVEEELGVLRENWTWQDPELGKLSRRIRNLPALERGAFGRSEKPARTGDVWRQTPRLRVDRRPREM